MRCGCIESGTSLSVAASRQAVPGGGSHFGGWRFAPTPLRCSIRGCAAELAARCALRSDSFGESVTKRALRANFESALLAASEIAPTGHRLPRSRGLVFHCCAPTLFLQRRARTHGNAPLKRRAAQGMRPRALARSLTDSPRLLERSAQRVASSAVGRMTEQRRAVAAGDRFSEALTGVRARLCRAVQRTRGA